MYTDAKKQPWVKMKELKKRDTLLSANISKSSRLLPLFPSFSVTSCLVVSRCFILRCHVSSRQLSSSALSNPSWQSSPSSCRPLANITTEILSEQHLSSFSRLPLTHVSARRTSPPFMCTRQQCASEDSHIAASQEAR